jgi:hypothetical protein
MGAKGPWDQRGRPAARAPAAVSGPKRTRLGQGQLIARRAGFNCGVSRRGGLAGADVGHVAAMAAGRGKIVQHLAQGQLDQELLLEGHAELGQEERVEAQLQEGLRCGTMVARSMPDRSCRMSSTVSRIEAATGRRKRPPARRPAGDVWALGRPIESGRGHLQRRCVLPGASEALRRLDPVAACVRRDRSAARCGGAAGRRYGAHGPVEVRGRYLPQAAGRAQQAGVVGHGSPSSGAGTGWR